MCPCWTSLSSPFPLSHDWRKVRIAPLSLWWAWLAYSNWVLRKFRQDPESLSHDLWLAWLVLTHHHHHQQQLPFHQTPQERVRWLLFRLPLCLFKVRFSGCLELFSNSHVSVFRECSPWFWPPLIRTSLPFGHHEYHLFWVDSSLMVPWASLRLLASENKTRGPPLPDHLKNLLIWKDSITMIPPSLCNMSLEHQVGFPS